MAIAYKNKNVDKVATAKEMLDDFRTAFEKAEIKDAKWLLDNLNAKMAEGELAGIQKAINMVQNAINNDPAEFIRSLFQDLKPDNSYSSLVNLNKELHQVLVAKNKSKEQEQIFVYDIEEAITLGVINNVVAWMTVINLLNEYVLKPAGEKGSTAPDEAKKILQDALNKLNASKEAFDPFLHITLRLWTLNEASSSTQSRQASSKLSATLFAEASKNDLLTEMSNLAFNAKI